MPFDPRHNPLRSPGRAARWRASTFALLRFSLLFWAAIYLVLIVMSGHTYIRSVAFTLSLVLVRAALGPTVFDRVQAANTVGTCALMLLALIGFLTGRPEFLDLAIVYGLLNVIGTIAVLKYFRYGGLGDTGEEREERP